MSIDKIVERLKLLDSKATKIPWSHNTQMIFGNSVGGCQMIESEHKVADIRGWGHLQYLGEKKAMETQDANGDLIAGMRNAFPTLFSIIKIQDEALKFIADPGNTGAECQREAEHAIEECEKLAEEAK